MIPLLLAWLLLPQPTQNPNPSQAPPLRLDEVLASTERHYPPLLAALREVEAARGELVTAKGSFDTKLNVDAMIDRLGFYQNERFDVGVEQAFQWWGAKMYAGWRIGEGGFAEYDGLLETRDGGEFNAGFKLPLLRGRIIDGSRADLRRNELGIGIAEQGYRQQRLIIRRLATAAYWEWVAAGRGLFVARGVLDLAMARDALVRESVAAGATAAIEVIDNKRAILSRQEKLISAEQKLMKAAIYLSLYYRDGRGQPLLPGEDRLPEAFPTPRPFAPDRVENDIALALERRPELRRVRVETESVRVDQRLANNDRLPNLDFSVKGATESGENKDVKRGPDSVKVGLALKFPLQQRKAKGKQLKANAKLSQLERKEQFLIDKIAVEVREAAMSVEVGFRKADLLRQEVEVARELQILERERYELGDSNLFTVNLREESAAKAEIRRLKTLADYFRALAYYQLVTAEP